MPVCCNSSTKPHRNLEFLFVTSPIQNFLHWVLNFLDLLFASGSFIYQQMHFISVLENIKIYIKTYIKISATCFGLRPSSGSLHMSLAEVMFIKLVKVRLYGLCGCVAACCIKCVCCLCCVLRSILTLLGSGHQKPAWNLPVPNVL